MKKNLFDMLKINRNAQGMIEYALVMTFVVLLITAILHFSEVKTGILAIFNLVGSILGA